MPDSLMAFMQKTFVVPSGSWRETHHVKHFASKAEVTSIYLGGWNLVALTVSGLVRPARR